MPRPVCRELLVLGRKLVSAYHDPIASEASKDTAREAINRGNPGTQGLAQDLLFNILERAA
jgi:hypothetical protein